MPVVVLLGDHRCDKRMALIQFYLPVKEKRKKTRDLVKVKVF